MIFGHTYTNIHNKYRSQHDTKPKKPPKTRSFPCMDGFGAHSYGKRSAERIATTKLLFRNSYHFQNFLPACTALLSSRASCAGMHQGLAAGHFHTGHSHTTGACSAEQFCQRFTQASPSSRATNEQNFPLFLPLMQPRGHCHGAICRYTSTVAPCSHEASGEARRTFAASD